MWGFGKIPRIEAEILAVNTLRSTNKVHVVTDRSQKNGIACKQCAYSARCGVSRKFFE